MLIFVYISNLITFYSMHILRFYKFNLYLSNKACKPNVQFCYLTVAFSFLKYFVYTLNPIVTNSYNSLCMCVCLLGSLNKYLNLHIMYSLLPPLFLFSFVFFYIF